MLLLHTVGSYDSTRPHQHSLRTHAVPARLKVMGARPEDLEATLFLASHSFQVVLLCVGFYATRPPSWRVVPGPLESLLGRMPDKGEAYARLMQETGVGGKGAASGA